MTETLRRIKPLTSIKNVPTVDPGPLPEFRWVVPTDLYVDEAYQRDLRVRSFRLIEKIVRNFLWRRIKPVIAVELPDGKLHCIDGQHTATAAATRNIPLIPAFIVQAETLEQRADAFVGHNRDRIVMDPLDVYKGLLRAKDPDAMDIHNVCERAGVRICQLQGNGYTKAGDCAAVGVIGAMVRRHSPMKARKVLEALVKAGCSPISRVEIDAVEALMLVTYPNASIEQVASVIRALGDEGIIRAKVRAAAEKRPNKHTLYEAYAEIMEKQNAAIV